MKRFIELHCKDTKRLDSFLAPVWVNIDYITFMKCSGFNSIGEEINVHGTLVFLRDEQYLNVKELPKEILALIHASYQNK